jgi:queuine tRNA-ribosyltransferase
MTLSGNTGAHYALQMNTPHAHFGFQTLSIDGLARVGVLQTARGPIDTPAFMTAGTAGTVKAMTADAVRATGCQCVVANTYHLMLRPGAERI